MHEFFAKPIRHPALPIKLQGETVTRDGQPTYMTIFRGNQFVYNEDQIKHDELGPYINLFEYTGDPSRHRTFAMPVQLNYDKWVGMAKVDKFGSLVIELTDDALPSPLTIKDFDIALGWTCTADNKATIFCFSLVPRYSPQGTEK